MELVFKTEDAISKLLTIKIEYFDSLQIYLLNDLWVHEMEGDFFLKEVESFKPILKRQLKYGLNPEEYINKVCKRIKEKLEFLEEHKVGSIEFLQFYCKQIKPITEITTFPSLGTDFYDEFKTSLKECKTDETDLYKFLVRFAEGNFNYTKYHEFSIGCLSYVIWNYYCALTELYRFVSTLQENAPFVDFSNLDIEDNKKCTEHLKTDIKVHFNQDKISVAHLFLFLLKEKHIVFDCKDERNNELQLKRFIEAHLTYLNINGDRVPIRSFNREFSEARASTKVQKHKQFINKFIYGLEQYRDSLKD
ncbi:hypothetical protein [Winogradskyella poriferorum]|uniref:hypothetical protein n=1 Tax=Winogradskyella poriferorum TaxID=307627 RepID=UPI003D646AA5